MYEMKASNGFYHLCRIRNQ